MHGEKRRFTPQGRVNAGHHLYSRARWRHPVWGLRVQVLRDQPFCAECQAEGRHFALAEEVDHIVPHRGSEVLFFERKNLRGLCKRHHSEKTQRGD